MVDALMDLSLKQTAMPGRISPQPAAPHHGHPVYLTLKTDKHADCTHEPTKHHSPCKDRNANKVSFEKKSRWCNWNFY